MKCKICDKEIPERVANFDETKLRIIDGYNLEGTGWVHAHCAIEKLEDEKKRRIYYQDIVYNVCHALDRAAGQRVIEPVVCGTLDEPSTEVQETIDRVVTELLERRGKKK